MEPWPINYLLFYGPLIKGHRIIIINGGKHWWSLEQENLYSSSPFPDGHPSRWIHTLLSRKTYFINFSLIHQVCMEWGPENMKKKNVREGWQTLRTF